MKTPEICPVCDEDVPPKAKACPNCGADERSGWNEEALLYDGLDLPEEAWGDSEDAETHSQRSGDVSPLWKLAALLALAGFLWWILGGLLSVL